MGGTYAGGQGGLVRAGRCPPFGLHRSQDVKDSYVSLGTRTHDSQMVY